MNERIEKVAQRYAESLVITKFLDNTSKGCGAISAVLTAGSIIAGLATSLGFIIPLGIILGGIPFLLVSLASKVFSDKKYNEILGDDMSKEEFKNLIKNGEMQKYLQNILENKKNGVGTMEKLDSMLKGEIKTPIGGKGLINSVKKEIYGKDKPKVR